MAGIGFELKKLFDRRTLTGHAMAYGYSAVITAGPFALLAAMVFAIQLLFSGYGISEEESRLYIGSVVYVFIFSQLVSCGFATMITRYLADCLYEGKYDNLTASCYGIILLAQMTGALLALVFYSDKPLDMHLKLITYVFFMEMIAMWIQMVYLTALKDYKTIFLSYLSGAVVSIGLAWLNLHLGFFEPVAGTLLAMSIGTGGLVLGLMVQIGGYFGFSADGMNFEFLPYFEKHGRLFLIMLCYNLSLYAANFFVWQGDWGEMVAGTYLFSPRYDVITFYAFLSVLPSMIMFVVSMELKFYEQYAVYFTYITQKGNFQEVDASRKDLLQTLWSEFKNIMELQLVFSLMFLAAGSYILSLGGIGYQDVNIYRVLVLAAFFCAIMQVIYILLLYLEDQRGAMLITAGFLLANLILGMIGCIVGEISYGFTLFLAAVFACGVALWRLQYFCRRINYYVFCSRPVFLEAPHGIFAKIAARLYGRRIIRERREES